MTMPAAVARSTVFTALDHPEIADAWAEYEAANERAAADYRGRVHFREVRRDNEWHLFPVAAS